MSLSWYRVSVIPTPTSTPPFLLKYCEAREFFMPVTNEKSAQAKAEKRVIGMSKELLLEAFQDAGGDHSAETPENIAVFNFWLKQNGQHWVSPESKTFAAIINDCFDCYRDVYKIESISNAPNCEACRYNELGQLAHMSEGGCLYDPSY